MNKNKILLAVLTVLLGACSITQNIEPSSISGNQELCIIENPPVRDSFLVELKKVLADNGIPYRMIPENSRLDACEWTTTYLARWSWDLTIYMSLVEIKIYQNGVLDGEATYDARSGGGRLDKFIDAEPKIKELIDALLEEEGLSQLQL